jgi:hypothetical protein
MAAQTKNHSEESLTRWGKISLANSLKKNMYFSNQRPKAKDKARKERVCILVNLLPVVQSKN